VLTESASLVVELHRAVGLAPAREQQAPAAGAGQQQQQQPEQQQDEAAAAAGGAAAAGAAEGQQHQQQDEGQQEQAEQPAGAAPQRPPQPPPERLSQSQLQQRYRRAAALVDVSIALLRLLEAVARDAPAVFLCGGTAPLAMARLIELMSFVLRHYCSGAEARRLGQLLRQRSIALARQRRVGAGAGAGAAGGAGAAARAAFPLPAAAGGGGGALNFNVPVPGIGNLTFLVHTQIDESSDGGAGAGDDGAEGGGGDDGGAAAAAAAEQQSPVERLARAAVLAPLAGIILNLAAAEALPDEAPEGSDGSTSSGSSDASGVRSTAALVGTKQLRQRPGAAAPAAGGVCSLCPRGAPRRRSFLEQLAGSDIPLDSLRQLLALDWLQLEASRRLLRPERTAGAVAGLLLQDSADLRSGADALREERRRSHTAAGGGGGGQGSPRPMETEEAAGAAGGQDEDMTASWEAAAATAGNGGGGDGDEAMAPADAAPAGAEPGPALRAQLERLCSVLDAIAARRAAAAGAGGGAGGGPGGGGAAAPDEFLDPLTAAMMEDPVILPASRMVVDRSTIARWGGGWGGARLARGWRGRGRASGRGWAAALSVPSHPLPACFRGTH
jgi:hypothetical protein